MTHFNPLPRQINGRFKRADVLPLADYITDQLVDVCEKVIVAGSIRRDSPTVKDIEIVCLVHDIAAYKACTDRLLNRGIAVKANYGKPGHTLYRWGPKYRCLSMTGINIELSAATPHTFGYMLWLRTGPAPANKYVMAQWQYKVGLSFNDGKVYDRASSKQISIPDERAMFDALRFPFIAPSERSERAYRAASQSPLSPRTFATVTTTPNTPPQQISLF